MMDLGDEIIDIFENFLEEHGIDIPNSEKIGDIDEAIIYGTDYGNLHQSIMELLSTKN